MGKLYLNDADRRRIVTQWIQVSLFALHAWGTMLILAILWGKDSAAIPAMFSTVCFGIGLTLGILLLDRAADIVLDRIASWVGKSDSVPAPQTAKMEGEMTISGGAA